MNQNSDSEKQKSLIDEGEDFGPKPRQFKSGKINDNIKNFFNKKIKFDSAFDHKGSKHFLHSKKAALEQIVIDDNDSSNNDSETQSASITKKKKHLKYKHPKTCKTTKILNKAQSSNDLGTIMNNKLKHKTADPKDKNFKRDLIRTLVTNELNVHKRINKNFSSQELKMFEDKEIKKIKPIKKLDSINQTNGENKQRIFPFVEEDNSIDSSLMKIVSQIK